MRILLSLSFTGLLIAPIIASAPSFTLSTTCRVCSGAVAGSSTAIDIRSMSLSLVLWFHHFFQPMVHCQLSARASLKKSFVSLPVVIAFMRVTAHFAKASIPSSLFWRALRCDFVVLDRCGPAPFSSFQVSSQLIFCGRLDAPRFCTAFSHSVFTSIQLLRAFLALIIFVVSTDGVAEVRQQHLFRRSASLVLCHSAGVFPPSRSDLGVFFTNCIFDKSGPLLFFCSSQSLVLPISRSELCATW